MLPLRCEPRGVVQFKEVTPGSNHKGTPIKEGTPGSSVSSLKTQAQGRKDTPSRSKVSSSFKTQQTGQGRILKADSQVHSDLATRLNTN
jgi:hypothetical protein